MVLRKRFWTLSVWDDRGSVRAFVGAGPHEVAVQRFADWAGEGAAFVEWTSRDGRLDWKEALERLESPSFAYKPPRPREK